MNLAGCILFVKILNLTPRRRTRSQSKRFDQHRRLSVSQDLASGRVSAVTAEGELSLSHTQPLDKARIDGMLLSILEVVPNPRKRFSPIEN
jgi:hypothetical protein